MQQENNPKSKVTGAKRKISQTMEGTVMITINSSGYVCYRFPKNYEEYKADIKLLRSRPEYAKMYIKICRKQLILWRVDDN